MDNINNENLYNILDIIEKNSNNINENDYNLICIELKELNSYINILNYKINNLYNENIKINKNFDSFIEIINKFRLINLKLINEIKNNQKRNVVVTGKI